MKAGIFALIALLTLTLFLPTALAVFQASENFQNDTPPNTPTEDWYTYTGTGGAVLVNPQTYWVNSFRMVDDAAGSNLPIFDNSEEFPWDLCAGYAGSAGGVFSFAFNMTTLPSGSVKNEFFISDAGGFSRAAGFSVSSAGVVTVRAIASGGEANVVMAGVTVVADKWYNVTINPAAAIDGCLAGQARVYFANENVFTDANAAGTFADLGLGRFSVSEDGGTDAATYWLDNLYLASGDPIVAVGAAESVSDFDAGSLVGFDIDTGGRTVIARVGNPGCGGCTVGGHDIHAYDGQTLTGVPANPVDTDCDRIDGVMSQGGAHVLFVECGGDCNPQDPCKFLIRSASLGAPDFDECGDECPADLDMSEGDSVSDGGGDGVTELGEVEGFPIDFSNRQATSDIFDEAHIAMAYTGNQGELGVQVYSGCNNCPDNWYFDEVGFSTTTPDHLCTGVRAGQYYVGAADSGGPPAIYDVDFVNTVFPEMTLFHSGSSATSGGKGIDCAGFQYITVVERASGADGDTVWVTNMTTGTATQLATTDGLTRGVAMSQSNLFRYFAWVDSNGASADTILIGNGLPGNVTCELTMPSGVFHSMEFDFAAQNLWVATDTVIARFAVQENGCTTDNPQSNIGGIGGETPPEVVTTGALANAGNAFAPFGVGRFGGNLIWAFITIGCVAMGTGTSFVGIGKAIRVKEGRTLLEFAKWGLTVGAVVGFFLAYALNFLNTAMVAGVLIMGAVSVSLRYYFKRMKTGG